MRAPSSPARNSRIRGMGGKGRRMLPTSLCQFSRLVGRERPGGFPKQETQSVAGRGKGSVSCI